MGIVKVIRLPVHVERKGRHIRFRASLNYSHFRTAIQRSQNTIRSLRPPPRGRQQRDCLTNAWDPTALYSTRHARSKRYSCFRRYLNRRSKLATCGSSDGLPRAKELILLKAVLSIVPRAGDAEAAATGAAAAAPAAAGGAAVEHADVAAAGHSHAASAAAARTAADAAADERVAAGHAHAAAHAAAGAAAEHAGGGGAAENATDAASAAPAPPPSPASPPSP